MAALGARLVLAHVLAGAAIVLQGCGGGRSQAGCVEAGDEVGARPGARVRAKARAKAGAEAGAKAGAKVGCGCGPPDAPYDGADYVTPGELCEEWLEPCGSLSARHAEPLNWYQTYVNENNSGEVMTCNTEASIDGNCGWFGRGAGHRTGPCDYAFVNNFVGRLDHAKVPSGYLPDAAADVCSAPWSVCDTPFMFFTSGLSLFYYYIFSERVPQAVRDKYTSSLAHLVQNLDAAADPSNTNYWRCDPSSSDPNVRDGPFVWALYGLNAGGWGCAYLEDENKDASRMHFAVVLQALLGKREVPDPTTSKRCDSAYCESCDGNACADYDANEPWGFGPWPDYFDACTWTWNPSCTCVGRYETAKHDCPAVDHELTAEFTGLAGAKDRFDSVGLTTTERLATLMSQHVSGADPGWHVIQHNQFDNVICLGHLFSSLDVVGNAMGDGAAFLKFLGPGTDEMLGFITAWLSLMAFENDGFGSCSEKAHSFKGYFNCIAFPG